MSQGANRYRGDQCNPGSLVSQRYRRLLLGGSALAAVFAVSALVPTSALAENECGALAATVDCTGSFSPGSPAGNVNGGIEYAPTSGEDPFVLNFGDGTPGGSASVQAPTISGTIVGSSFTVGQTGIFVGKSKEVDLNVGILGTHINGVVVPYDGVTSDVTVNVNQSSQVMGSAFGVFAWTTGDGNDAVVNNYGQITATGGGTDILVPGVVPVVGGVSVGGPGTGINVVSDGGNATAHNYNAIDANSNGINLWTGNGGVATATNDGSITSHMRDGIAIADQATGLLPSDGSAVVENSGSIDAERNGIFILSTGDATVTLGTTSTVDAGNDGVYILSGGIVNVTNSGEIGSDGTRVGERGIDANGATVTVANYGSSIYTVGDSIHAVAGGDVTVNNGDPIGRAHV